MEERDALAATDVRQLRRFGFILAAIITVLFGVIPWLRGHMIPRWPWMVALVLSAWALVAPSTLSGFFRVWMRVGLALGWVNSRIILAFAFFGLFTPVALVFRLAGRDVLARRFDAGLATYRRASESSPPKQMERPF